MSVYFSSSFLSIILCYKGYYRVYCGCQKKNHENCSRRQLDNLQHFHFRLLYLFYRGKLRTAATPYSNEIFRNMTQFSWLRISLFIYQYTGETPKNVYYLTRKKFSTFCKVLQIKLRVGLRST